MHNQNANQQTHLVQHINIRTIGDQKLRAGWEVGIRCDVQEAVALLNLNKKHM